MPKNINNTKEDIVADTQIVVLMGGLGTRLGLKDIPKAMADVHGHPFFDYQLKVLKRWRFHKFLFLVGYQADYIENYYGDGTEKQIDIQYSYDGERPLGTGGALKNAEEKLEKDFLLIYGDSFMDIDYQEVVYRYQEEKTAGKTGIMTILNNENCFDKSNVVYRDGKLLLYDKTNTNDEMHYIDYGVSMMSKKALSEKRADKSFDLSEIFTSLSKSGKLAAQVVTKRFFEIGSQKSLMEFRDYAKKRFYERNKAVFFDRDGVINEIFYNDNIEQLDSPYRKEDFRYREGIINQLLAIQKMGFYIFIVTNQPAAAKGNITVSKLYDLNTWMILDLQSKGITVEFVNICPHYPTSTSRIKSSFLIRTCNCRKPEAGLITDLLQIYNIVPQDSYMVGDSYTDILAGKKAGLKTVLLGGLKCDACQQLKGNRPDWIIHEPAGLKNIVEVENIYV